MREIAAVLCVSENAIKLHLANLADKFAIQGGSSTNATRTCVSSWLRRSGHGREGDRHALSAPAATTGHPVDVVLFADQPLRRVAP